MYTSHGHQIPNTPVEGDRPALVARCGGPGLCNTCSGEILYGMRDVKAVKHPVGDPPPNMRVEDKARFMVAQYINARLPDDSAIEPLGLKDIYLVWFSKTLQNWKALVTTNIPDGFFFEISHNGDKKETYLDAYVKWQNVVIPGGGF